MFPSGVTHPHHLTHQLFEKLSTSRAVARMKSPQQQTPGNPVPLQPQSMQGRIPHSEKHRTPSALRTPQSSSTPETARGEPRGWAKRLPPLINDNQNAKGQEVQVGKEMQGSHYADHCPAYAGRHVHVAVDPSREQGNGQHYDRRYSYGQNFQPSVRPMEFMPPRLEYTDMRVFSTPYGYTANNQPLFIQYGTPSGDVAAQAVLALGHGYYCQGQYGMETADGYYQYGSGVRQGVEDYRYGVQRGMEWRGAHAVEVGDGNGIDGGRGVGPTGPEGLAHENQGDRGSKGRRMEGVDVARREDIGVDGGVVVMEADENVEKKGTGCGEAVDEMAAACTLEELREMRDAEKRGEEKHVDTGENSGMVQLMQKASGRITWTQELHAEFLKALDELGLEHAVPMSILNKMGVSGLTREQVASHLQKHRTMLRKEREVKERTMLLNMAARSVLKRDENLGKRSLTAEEVMDAVAKEEQLNGAEEGKEGKEGKERKEGRSEVEERKKAMLKGGFCKLGKSKRNGTKVKEVIGKGKRFSRRGLHTIAKQTVCE